MAILLPVEERDDRGATIRVNPSITWIQDRTIRKVIGRHDFQTLDNPDYHPPITVQVQNGVLKFFNGTPNSKQTRALAKEMQQADVPQYIITQLAKHPVIVRERRPMVYEVKLATIGDVETTVTAEIPLGDGETAVTVSPVAPDIAPKNNRGGRPTTGFAEDAGAPGLEAAVG